MKTYEQMAADVLRRRDEAVALQAKKNRTVRRVAVAASVCLVTVGVTAGIWGVSVLNKPDDSTDPPKIGQTVPAPIIPLETAPNGSFWDDTRERKEISIMKPETAIEWGWEDMTDAERYTNLDLGGRTYRRKSGTVTGYLGEWLADGEAYGFAWDQDNARHGIPCEIYSLTFSPDHSVVAVQFEGQSNIYRFECEKGYDPPKTLGEFMETRKLSEVLPLTTLYYNNGWEDSKHSLSAEDSDTVWNILAKYGEAPFVKDYTYYHNKEDVGFSATSEVLGIRNMSFTINEEGYIVTNIEQYGYYYNIGVDAAREVIDFVKAHMIDPLPEAKEKVYQIIGTVTEIGEGYIKVDDSITMKNPKDGLEFTIITEKKNLSRVVKYMAVGNEVMIIYDGFVSKEDPLLIEYATAIYSIQITGDGDILIPE